MRDIEFRAWDKSEKRMLPACSIHKFDESPVWRKEGDGYIESTTYGFDDENLEWLEYTGLKDKNGKKIFEGDIIEWDPKEWGCEYREEVEWDYELLSMRMNDWSEWCEVIGNIYENPELLVDTIKKS